MARHALLVYVRRRTRGAPAGPTGEARYSLCCLLLPAVILADMVAATAGSAVTGSELLGSGITGIGLVGVIGVGVGIGVAVAAIGVAQWRAERARRVQVDLARSGLAVARNHLADALGRCSRRWDGDDLDPLTPAVADLARQVDDLEQLAARGRPGPAFVDGARSLRDRHRTLEQLVEGLEQLGRVAAPGTDLADLESGQTLFPLPQPGEPGGSPGARRRKRPDPPTAVSIERLVKRRQRLDRASLEIVAEVGTVDLGEPGDLVERIAQLAEAHQALRSSVYRHWSRMFPDHAAVRGQQAMADMAAIHRIQSSLPRPGPAPTVSGRATSDDGPPDGLWPVIVGWPDD